ncbi:MAG: hypothetical protein ACM3SR_10455 [Ignavibacteriales bacterium]
MEKKRRLSAMEEAKKEPKVEGVEEIREKAAERVNLKVRDYVDMTRELTGLVKESYITGLRLFFSIYEGNLKVINRQAEEWGRLHEESTKLMREPFERFPTEMVNFWNGHSKLTNSHVEKIIDFQRDYSQAVLALSQLKQGRFRAMHTLSVTLAHDGLPDRITSIFCGGF